MSDTSKLGPIDPQMQTFDRAGRPIRRPAKAFIDAYESLVTSAHAAIAGHKPFQAYFALLNNEDPSWIMECIRARNATKRLIDQPDVIEKILTYLSLWPHTAHAPPAAAVA